MRSVVVLAVDVKVVLAQFIHPMRHASQVSPRSTSSLRRWNVDGALRRPKGIT